MAAILNKSSLNRLHLFWSKQDLDHTAKQPVLFMLPCKLEKLYSFVRELTLRVKNQSVYLMLHSTPKEYFKTAWIE